MCPLAQMGSEGGESVDNEIEGSESKTNIGENFKGFCNLVFDTTNLSFLLLSPTNNAWQVMGRCFALFGTVW